MKTSCAGRIRTCGLWVMGPASYLCSTSQYTGSSPVSCQHCAAGYADTLGLTMGPGKSSGLASTVISYRALILDSRFAKEKNN